MTLLNALLERADLNSLFNELDALTEEYATSLQRLQLHEGLDEISDILSDKAKKLSDNIQRVQLIRDRTREEMKDGRMDKKDAIRHQHKAVVSMQKDLKTVSGLIGKFNTAIDRYIEKTKHLSKDPELSDLLKKKRQQDKGNDDLGGQDDQLASDLAKIRRDRQRKPFDEFGRQRKELPPEDQRKRLRRKKTITPDDERKERAKAKTRDVLKKAKEREAQKTKAFKSRHPE